MCYTFFDRKVNSDEKVKTGNANPDEKVKTGRCPVYFTFLT